ncbi:hypothetical protein IW262DRAFT_871881 [Armillaria fumosa]|nr:hypothetical protein IW262DRAFT_871881 [Armillaria fumosa]
MTLSPCLILSALITGCSVSLSYHEGFLRYIIMQDMPKREQLMMLKTLVEFLTKTYPSVLCLEYRHRHFFVKMIPVTECPMVRQELTEKRNLN